MIYVVRCPYCLHLVGSEPPTRQDEKVICSHCNKEIENKGEFIQEPVEAAKETDLLSVN